MKIEVLKENLKTGLGVAERNIGKNLSLPILNNIFIAADESFLRFTSTDLETIVKFWTLAKVIKKGDTVLPARILSDFVSYLPNDKVFMEAHEQAVNIECQKFTTTIQGFNPEDFPLIPEFKGTDSLIVDNKKFCQGLAQVVSIAAQSASRPEISGIYFSFVKNTLTIAATDSFRLAEKKFQLEQGVQNNHSFILPQKSARMLLNILEERNGQLTILFSVNQVMVELPFADKKHPHIQVTSRLIEGEYPNYQEIIPGQFKTTATINRDEFLNQIKTASLFANRNNEVKLSLNPTKKEIGVFTQNPGVGESHSSLPGTIEGEPIDVSFNYKFLVDGLQNIKSSEIVFEASGSEGPCVLKPVADASYLYVVMPIKAI